MSNQPPFYDPVLDSCVSGSSSEDERQVIGYADEGKLRDDKVSMTKTQDQARAVEVSDAIHVMRKSLKEAGAKPSVEVWSHDLRTLLSNHTTRAETIAKQADEIERLKELHDEERHVEIYDTGFEDGRGLSQDLIDGLVDRAIAAEAKLVESEAREGALREALTKITKIKAERVTDDFVTGPQAHFDAAKRIARAALTLKGRSA